ncbi:aminoacyl tRNA synthase complex-interacting multifunctional protein 1 [Lates calcarifer]|uniref:Aminoacyl tRNA synthase complex-interacting multifunctional protein 1 n=1 Tax=Lates calcarifer TaxID=8187 RepID=A0A4W6DIC5_LATCA|nr:aminoacyl tRNA synthase complex-interacting multifunctional protein 1 [Lates calcarifer]
MDNADNLFNPSLAAALMKLDPEDGEQILEYFKTHALLTREKALLQASVREQKKLLVENSKLKKDIEELRLQLQEKQRRRTAKALLSPAPPPPTLSPAPTTPVSQTASPAGATAGVPTNRPPPSSSSHDQRERQSRRRRGERKARSTSDSLSLGEEPKVDVSRLDLRIGRILNVRRHPLAETMSIQEVDVGENAPRMVVSKLGGKTNLEELRGSLAVLLCNVKACKVRSVVSQARLLCCSSSDDCIELLAPPTGSAPGDRVTFLNYPGDPDRELQSKQKVWELLQPDLLVDCKGVANYKGCGFEVKGKGLCRAPSLTNCTIR